MKHRPLAIILILATLAASLSGPALAAPLQTDTLTNALAGWWPLDEPSGTRTEVYNSLDLLDGNTVTAAYGKGSRAALFTRANSEYLHRSTDGLLSPGDKDFTIALWVNLTTKANDMALVSKSQNATTREYSLWYDASEDSFIFELYQTGGASIGAADATLFSPLVDTWYFVLASYDASADTVTVVIDNTYVGQDTTTAAPAQTAADFEVGRRETTDYLDGQIDELAFWNKTLTSFEKEILYNTAYGVTLDPVTWDIGYLYTVSVNMSGGLPAEWYDLCANEEWTGYEWTGVQSGYGNDVHDEMSGVPSWGQVIDDDDVEGVCGPGDHEAWTKVTWYWEDDRLLRAVRVAYLNGDDNHGAKLLVQDPDDEWDVLAEGPWSIGTWQSVEWFGTAPAIRVRVSNFDADDALEPIPDVAVVDDFTVTLQCNDGPCSADPIPIAQDEYIDVACYAGAPDCWLYSWLKTDPDAFVYSTVAGTVVMRSQNSDGSYMVIIEDDTGIQWAFTNLSTAFVGYGDPVEEGCLLGQVSDYPGTIPGQEPLINYGAVGWAKVTAGVYSDPWPVLWHYAIPGDFCGQGYYNDNCNLDNPFFYNNAIGWDYTPEGDPVQPRVVPFSGHPSFSGGVVLEEAESYLHYLYDEPAIWQQVILDPESTYYVTVVAQQTWWLIPRVLHMADTGHVRVTLGDATPEVLTLDGTNVTILEFGPITPVPDGVGNLTTVKLENDGYSEMSVYHVCVSNASLDTAPGNCFFDDWNFQSPYITPTWTYAPGAGSEPNPPWYGIPSSTLDMPTWIQLVLNDNILQNKTLYPEDGGGQMDYLIKVRATAHNASSAGADWGQLDVTFGAYSNTFTFDYADIQTTAPQEDTFSITTDPVTDDFEFEVSALNGAVDGIDLEYVCLLPGEPGGLPGYDDAIPPIGGDGGGGGGGGTAQCVTCRPPGGLLNVAEWVKFLACIIKNLYYCHLAPLVETLLTVLRDAAKLIYKLGTWLGNMTKIQLAWVKGLLAQILERLLAALVSLINKLLALDFLARLLEAATITIEFIPRAISLIGRLVTLLGKALALAGSLAKAGDRMADTFIAALNSSQQASLTYPDCENENDTLYAICQGLSIVESRLPMAVLNVLGMGGLGIALTFWTFGKFADFMKD